MNLDLNYFIDKNLNKDLIELIIDITKEVDSLKKWKCPKDLEYSKEKYLDTIGDFLQFLNTGTIPAGIGINGLKKFKPIITYLANGKGLTKDVLVIFQE